MKKRDPLKALEFRFEIVAGPDRQLRFRFTDDDERKPENPNILRALKTQKASLN